MFRLRESFGRQFSVSSMSVCQILQTLVCELTWQSFPLLFLLADRKDPYSANPVSLEMEKVLHEATDSVVLTDPRYHLGHLAAVRPSIWLRALLAWPGQTRFFCSETSRTKLQ